MWASGKTAQNGHGSAGDSSKAAESSPAPEHWCQEHQTEFKRYERQRKVWYSHKTADGKWCRDVTLHQVGSHSEAPGNLLGAFLGARGMLCIQEVKVLCGP